MADQSADVPERFSFLRGSYADSLPQRAPVNVFTIAGFPRRETVASNVLAFFLDPVDERHEFGSAFIDALLGCIDGWPLIDRNGRVLDKHLFADPLKGSTEWQVRTEYTTHDRKRVDVLLTNEIHRTAIVIENKIDATLVNPFSSYVQQVSKHFEHVAVVVLAPTRRAEELERRSLTSWVSGTLTFDELFTAFRRGTVDTSMINRRSLDLFEQLEENLSERRGRMSAQSDGAVLEAFWSQLRGKEQEFEEFFVALHEVNKVLVRRADEILLIITSKLEATDTVRGKFASSGHKAAWGRREGRVAVVYAGIVLEGGITAELVLGFLPKSRFYGMHFKAYGHGQPAERPFRDFDRLPLNASLADSNEVIADEVIALIDRAREAHPAR